MKEHDLMAAAAHGQGFIRIVPTSSHGKVAMAGGIVFAPEQNAYVEAVQSLCQLGLAKASDADAEHLFPLTERGLERAKCLPSLTIDDLRRRFTGRIV